MGNEHDEIVCWSRMQAEAGQSLQDIVVRKEIERRTGDGLFCWGVGNAPGQTAAKIAASGMKPGVVFSVMKGRPRELDARPAAVVVWRGYIGADGIERPLPDHCLVTSRSAATHLGQGRHYALMCRSEQELVLGDYGPFDPEDYRNVGGTGARVGASQVTALLRRVSSNGEGSYRINVRARLDLDMWVKLTDPVLLTRTRLEALRDLPGDMAGEAWRCFVAWLKDGPARRLFETAYQPALL
jgi:hypothetical protein